MTEQIKPKQCGKEAWYIPNQKGFVPKPGEWFWYCGKHCEIAQSTVNEFFSSDYAYINAGNCFETKQEALDAFVMPVDPTPLTWDELCEMHNRKDARIFSLHHCRNPARNPHIDCIFTDEVFAYGELLFKCGHKYWRSNESLEAWIEQQKGE